MSDRMRILPFDKLMLWALTEKERENSIFGVPDHKFFRKTNSNHFTLFDQTLENPLGPAAGPNTQLAQNIIASYVSGSRFFELKTVQIIDGDDLHVSKPCILAKDEGYNVEWSTELTVSDALSEYIKAWFALNILSKEFSLGSNRGFIFNMSVGYDLEGIKSPKINAFIDGLGNASQTTIWNECRDFLVNHLGIFKNISKEYIEKISPHICRSITLSTLHGCPSAEIERIATYLLEEKKLHTYIKCNPTLLGYEFARNTLDQMGYNDLVFDDYHFKNDLQFEEAVPMIARLKTLAKDLGLTFGVKLTNTFPVKIKNDELPGEEMYLSGRPLYPLTINLAYRLAKKFDGDIRISYSGGADFFNIAKIYRTGIWPITLATTILKPGGYLRLKQLADLLEAEFQVSEFTGVDVNKLSVLAEEAVSDANHLKSKKETRGSKLNQKVPLIDCFIAPCKNGCPIGQDIPEYIRLVGEGRYLEALEVITANNPLPFITGTLCNHRCMTRCTRQYYDEPVEIRATKLIAAEKAYPELMGIQDETASCFTCHEQNEPASQLTCHKQNNPVSQYTCHKQNEPVSQLTCHKQNNPVSQYTCHDQNEPASQFTCHELKPPEINSSFKVAVIGGGPTGLAAAYFLRKSGIDVTVFEKRDDIGGVIKHVIPDFRISREVIHHDMELIRKMGVKFCLGVDAGFSIEALKKDGFKYIFLAIGAEKPGRLKLEACDKEIMNVLEFLEAYNKTPDLLHLGKKVAVIGAGNSAMDAARAAKRVAGVETVSVVYRRTKKYMPADKEELAAALGDGVEWKELLAPVSFLNGVLRYQKMELGPPDASGRRSSVAVSGGFIELSVDSIIAAVGEQVETELFARNHIELDEKGRIKVNPDTNETSVENIFIGGDALRGPTTIVEGIADGTKFANIILKREKGHLQKPEKAIEFNLVKQMDEIKNKKGVLQKACNPCEENNRCLECHKECNLCVEVCPNRANIAVIVLPKNVTCQNQIIHIDGMCNECGNCESFCPYDSAPYKDKLTLYWNMEDFEGSRNSGFVLLDKALNLFRVRIGNNTEDVTFDLPGNCSGDIPKDLSDVIWTVYQKYSYLFM